MLVDELVYFTPHPARPLCVVSGALAKWMLCLQHVLVLWSDSSFCLVQYCYLGRSFYGSVSVCGFCASLPVWETSWVCRDCVHCVCVCICLSDVTMKLTAVSCCFWAKHTVLTGRMTWLNRHSQLFFLPSPILTPLGSPHSQCAKDSRSRRQWWGTYQCEPECRLVPLQAGTHINTDTHTQTGGYFHHLFLPLSSHHPVFMSLSLSLWKVSGGGQ